MGLLWLADKNQYTVRVNGCLANKKGNWECSGGKIQHWITNVRTASVFKWSVCKQSRPRCSQTSISTWELLCFLVTEVSFLIWTYFSKAYAPAARLMASCAVSGTASSSHKLLQVLQMSSSIWTLPPCQLSGAVATWQRLKLDIFHTSSAL